MKKIRKGDVVVIKSKEWYGYIGVIKGKRNLYEVEICNNGYTFLFLREFEVIDHIDETSEPIPPIRKEELTLDRAIQQLDQFFLFEEDTVDAASWRLVKTKLREGPDSIVYVNGKKYRVREGKTYNHMVDIVCAHCDHTILTLDLEKIIVDRGKDDH